jgi:hypothetical protein
MTPLELFFRVVQRLRTTVLRRREDWSVPDSAVHSRQPAVAEPFPVAPGDSVASADIEALSRECEDMLNGTYRMLAIRYSEQPLHWFKDPQTGAVSPDRFALDIDYRDPTVVGNVKNVWEKSRHHHLTQLAAAYRLTGDGRYGEEATRQLLDWLARNPPFRGVNWTSPLECGLRLISWCWVERLLRGTVFHSRITASESGFWTAVFWQQWYLSRFRSHGSSANNHLIGEAAGLYIAASCWPGFPESRAWRRQAWRVLEREIQRQTYACGANREHASAYHRFSLELFLLSAVERMRNGGGVSAPFSRRLAAMIRFMEQTIVPEGPAARYGDSDDAVAIRLSAQNASHGDWVLELRDRLHRGRDAERPLTPTAAIVAGTLAPTLLPSASESANGASIAYEGLGLYILRSRTSGEQSVECAIDAGDIGLGRMAAHGHADTLSVTLTVGELAILVDPGTYVYHVDPEWRARFRGTAFHNTISIAGTDQARQAGLFLWRGTCKPRVESWQPATDGGSLCAEHLGYWRAGLRTRHRRFVALSGDRLEIADGLRTSRRHGFRVHFHFHPDCLVDVEHHQCSVRRGEISLLMELDPQLRWHTTRGGPERGWYSPAFNRRVPATSLTGEGELSGSMNIRTLIEVQR